MLSLMTYLHYQPIKSLVTKFDNIIPFWNLHFILEMLAQSSKLDLTFYNQLINDFFNRFNTYCLHKFSLTQNLKIGCSLFIDQVCLQRSLWVL